jgi:hypothetical protein
MNNDIVLLSLDFKVVVSEFFKHSKAELGNGKINEITEKINSSKRVIKFMSEATKINQTPVPIDFFNCINSSTSFFFSNEIEISFAISLLLLKWNEEIGTTYELSNDGFLNETFFFILNKCEVINNKKNLGFFENYKNNIYKIFLSIYGHNSKDEIKNNVILNTMMCKAIEAELKTQFIVNDNLEAINFEPNQWEFISYNSIDGVKFKNVLLNEYFNVLFPYKLGDEIDVYENENSGIKFKIKLTSAFIIRLQSLNNDNAQDLGYSIYEKEIEEIYKQDPSADAELILLRENCFERFGSLCLNKNLWAFIFEFEYSKPNDSKMEQLLKAEIAKRNIDWSKLIQI